jgi:hypothetical protein
MDLRGRCCRSGCTRRRRCSLVDSASARCSSPRGLDRSTPTHGVALAGVALVALLLAGCGSDLRPVPRGELLSVPAEATVSNPSVALPAGYTRSVPPRQGWKAYASSAGAERAIDGDPATALTTPAEHGEDLWLLVDLGSTRSFRGVRQIHGDACGHAARYRIDVAGPKGYPWKRVWVGAGAAGESLAVFAKPIEARLLRITVLEEATPRCGVAELEVF